MESKRKIDSELGLFIYNIIKDSIYTNIQIAELLKVDERTINYYCTGERKPNQKRLLRLIKILNVDIQSIPF